MDDDQVAAAYDSRAAEYAALIGSIEQMERADVVFIEQWRDRTPGALLDAGCGPGHWTAFLAEGGREAVGVDVSAELLAAARAAHAHVRFAPASIRDLPFPEGAFGGVLAWYSLIHLRPDELPSALAELARVLEVGGRMLIGFFDGAPGEEFAHGVAPAYYWSTAALTPLLEEAGLRPVHAERREREPGAVGSARPHGAVEVVRVGMPGAADPRV